MLALDPYYEMFPTTYRRSYPPWRYSWGGLGQAASTQYSAAIGIGVGVAALTLGALWLARR